ncbi:MAG: hypothetical protein ACR2HZ_04790 [Gemmatimonadaceae bacterium]
MMIVSDFVLAPASWPYTPRIAPAWRRLGELLDEKGEHIGFVRSISVFLRETSATSALKEAKPYL